MFCPKCGTPGKGKTFCTRCGLQLGLVCYQGVPVTNKIMVASHNAPTIRVEPDLATRKLAATTAPNEIARVTTVATARLWPVAAKRAKTPSRVGPMLIGTLLLLAVTASGFWLRKNQGQTVQAQTVTSAQINEHNLSAGTVQTETAQTPARKYEWAVIENETRGVSGVEEALLADEKMAVVAPGGQLALDFRAGQFFGNGPQADLQVFGTAQEHVSYTLFVRNDPTAAWQRVDINRKTFATGVVGHDMGHHGVRQAKQVLIRNEAQSELHIDAVSALHPDVVSAIASHHAKPAQSSAQKARKRTVIAERRGEKSAKKKSRD